MAAAVYKYQADCDGKWSKIQFDFVSGTTEIVHLAEWNTMVNKMFAAQTADIQTALSKFTARRLIFSNGPPFSHPSLLYISVHYLDSLDVSPVSSPT